MSKSNKLFDVNGNKFILPFVLTVSSVLVVFFMIMVLSPVKKEQENTMASAPEVKKTETVDLEKVEADYKSKTAQVVKDYTEITGNGSFSTDDIERIKQQLLALKVPTQFKDLHIKLVMAMVRMESFLNGGSDDDKLVSEKTVNDAKKDYAWLN